MEKQQSDDDPIFNNSLTRIQQKRKPPIDQAIDFSKRPCHQHCGDGDNSQTSAPLTSFIQLKNNLVEIAGEAQRGIFKGDSLSSPVSTLNCTSEDSTQAVCTENSTPTSIDRKGCQHEQSKCSQREKAINETFEVSVYSKNCSDPSPSIINNNVEIENKLSEDSWICDAWSCSFCGQVSEETFLCYGCEMLSCSEECGCCDYGKALGGGVKFCRQLEGRSLQNVPENVAFRMEQFDNDQFLRGLNFDKQKLNKSAIRQFLGIGSKVSVYCPAYHDWFYAIVTSKLKGDYVAINYDDGTNDWLNVIRDEWHVETRNMLSCEKIRDHPRKLSLKKKRCGIGHRRIRKGKKQSSKKKSAFLMNEGISWRVPGSAKDVTRFGRFFVEKIRLRVESDSLKSDTTFMDHLLTHRMLLVETPFNGRKDQKPFDKIIEDDGLTYELVSCKVYDDNQGFGFCKSKVARLAYAKVGGADLVPFSMQDHLLRVADFTTLNPRKIAARLELFQSPSNLKIVCLNDSDFADIPDRGYVGGGFISEDKLLEVLDLAGMKENAAIRVTAIQVRLFIPSMGLYKGMLVKKRCTVGAPIELPWSMQKVLKSTHPEKFSGARIVVCKIGLHPSPGSANEYIGRRLDPERERPPEKSFKEKIKKPLSDMIFRLWQTMGVSKELCDEYKEKSLSPDRRNHGWLAGVPDPTDSLPPDTIFIPGMKACHHLEVFVTRSPCYAYEHGRKLTLVKLKPPQMSQQDWNWLNNELYFGVIIFSNPRPGMKSIPERIANGDLDGDLYLVCWDDQILASMDAVALKDEVSDDDGKLSTGPSSSTWFSDAQDIIVDAGMNNEIGRLTGILYKLGENIADSSESKLQDLDANAYYEAYNQALEFKKHGRPIVLPRHLIEAIPGGLQHLVVSDEMLDEEPQTIVLDDGSILI
jgi:hypothetical protein